LHHPFDTPFANIIPFAADKLIYAIEKSTVSRADRKSIGRRDMSGFEGRHHPPR